jgi:predicted dehydrogenase
MKRASRREFLRSSIVTAAAIGVPSLLLGRPRLGRGDGPNSEFRVGVVGLGGIDIVGGVGGRGRQLISRFRAVPGVRIAALCDVDQKVLEHETQPFRDRHEAVATYGDFRKMLDDKSIDAVAIATPNHWHALAMIWAVEAQKDVYVEKPFCYNIWEGRQMVAAARKYGRIVQVGTQSRSSEVLREAIEYLHSGQIGPIRCAHALIYRARQGIGKVDAPTPVPSSVDYDLWCGPAPKMPLLRKQLHYDWHWFWSTGNGEIGNNGAHGIDVGRWALGQNQPPRRAISIAGRFGFDDDAETPNTQIALFDYPDAPLICEVRNLRTAKEADAMGKFRGRDRGVVIQCEGGYFAGESTGGALFDNQGEKIKDFAGGKAQDVEIAHVTNFVAAVGSRNIKALHAEALQGHVSAACSHMANISHRLGEQSPPEAMLEATRANPVLVDALERCRQYLRANGVDLDTEHAVMGPWVTFDAEQERFVGAMADEANTLSERAYRQPFVVPKII